MFGKLFSRLLIACIMLATLLGITSAAPIYPKSLDFGLGLHVPASSPSLEKRLVELKSLLDKGLITPDEAAEKRRELLKEIGPVMRSTTDVRDEPANPPSLRFKSGRIKPQIVSATS